MTVDRSLAIGEVSLYSKRSDEVVAHAVGTYAIPQARSAGQCAQAGVPKRMWVSPQFLIWNMAQTGMPSTLRARGI